MNYMKTERPSASLLMLVAVLLPIYALWQNKRGQARPKEEIVILYDNDVHCAMDGYARMAGLRDSFLTTTGNVAVVSSGDFIQGDVMGSLTEGEYVVDVMNTVPYDYVTVGNHEFDYGVAQNLKLCGQLSAEVLCCNISGPKGDLYMPGAIRSFGGTKVGFVGVATPATFTSSTPTYFQDSLGNVIYDFHREDTYLRVQETVNRLRKEGAHYVVALVHLGDDEPVCPSPELAEKTYGINAILDGHAHHVFNWKKVNALGDTVILTSTGTKFQNYGVLRVKTDGTLDVQLRPRESVTVSAKRTERVVDSLRTCLAERTNRVVGYTPVELTDKDRSGERAVRRASTNLGLFLCNAFRYVADAEIGVMNGGGIRTDIPKGEITMGEIYSVLPFNNRIWRKRATGQQLLDALEWGVRNWPKEDGDYPHMAGLRFEIDGAVPTSVTADANNMFVSVGDTRRVKNVMVEGRDGKWRPIDPERTYTIAGQSYIMVSGGAGGMYMQAEKDYGPLCTDVEAVIQYLNR